MKRRSRNLNDADVADIVAILDGWSGKLSWDLLIDAVEARKFGRYTRQALHKHERIALAFVARKKALTQGSGSVPETESPELKMALERLTRAEREVERLNRENRLLLEQFARWAYNAHGRGLGKDFLDRPLPAVSREQTGKRSGKNVSNEHRRNQDVES